MTIIRATELFYHLGTADHLTKTPPMMHNGKAHFDIGNNHFAYAVVTISDTEIDIYFKSYGGAVEVVSGNHSRATITTLNDIINHKLGV